MTNTNNEKLQVVNEGNIELKDYRPIPVNGIDNYYYFSKLRKLVVNFYNLDLNFSDYWIFHHTDADGLCSGSLVYMWLVNIKKIPQPKIHLISSDYSNDYTKYDIKENDYVFFVDLSFTESSVNKLKAINNIVKGNIFWIDHHESNVDLLNNDKELDSMVNDWLACVLQDRKNIYSAAMLVYCTLFNTVPVNNVPRYVTLVSDWDTWNHNLPDSIYFTKGVNSDPDYWMSRYNKESDDYVINYNSVWFRLFNESFENSNETLMNNLIENARPVVDSEKVSNTRYLRSNGFETELFGYKVLACNQRSNSLLFGDEINNYDLVCPFVCHKRNGKMIYTYSLFTAKEDIVDCRKIAEQLGGGGHKKAAGFSLDFNIFTTNKHLLKFKLFKNKLKRKK